MPFDSNDPRLTAYALGELDDTERAAVETLVAESHDAQRFIEDVRETARLLRDELHAEPRPGLSDEQRDIIEDCLAAPASSPAALKGPLRWFGFAVAASVLVGSGVLAMQMFQPATKEPAQVAMLNKLVPKANRDFDVPASDSTSSGEAVRFKKSHWGMPADALTAEPTGSAPVAAEPPLMSYAPRSSRFAPISPPAAAAPAPAQMPGMMMMSGQPGFSGGQMSGMGGGMGMSQSRSKAKATVPDTYAYVPRRRSYASTLPGLAAPADEFDRPSKSDSSTLNEQSVLAKAKQPFGQVPHAEAQVSQKPGANSASLGLNVPNASGKSPVSGPGQNGKPTELFAYAGGKPEQNAGKPATSAEDQSAKSNASKSGDSVAREKEMVEKKAEVALALKDAERDEAKESILDSDTLVPPPPAEAPGNEDFAPIDENGFERVTELPQPTLSIDVDTASYANVRRFLNQNMMPPRDAVRIEEMINYFRYDDPEPKGDDPFSVNVEIARCPWNVNHRIARIGLKGKSIDTANRSMSNLVFLVDVSGSMMDANKLPLLKQSMKMLVETLGENDRVAIVVYAGSEGLALPSTSAEHKEVILSALEQLQAGGSTNGGAGITLAYQIATQNFIKGGVNRVILCTDGDFNVGITDRGQLDKLIAEKARSKVFLSVLGFGQGNLKDATMESLADKGNGNYAYIDSPKEGQKVLVDEAGATLVTIAKDVKVQVEFNPSHVAAYRLIGYENRVMAAQDFNNDQKDAGEIGAGHNVTVLFELVPPGKELAAAGPPADDLVFQKREPIGADVSKLAMMVKLRYKQPEGDVSKLIQQGVEDTGKDYAAASNDLKFSSAVASFGMLLRGSAFKGSANYDSVLELATASKGQDKSGYRTEFLELVRKAKELSSPRR